MPFIHFHEPIQILATGALSHNKRTRLFYILYAPMLFDIIYVLILIYIINPVVCIDKVNTSVRTLHIVHMHFFVYLYKHTNALTKYM